MAAALHVSNGDSTDLPATGLAHVQLLLGEREGRVWAPVGGLPTGVMAVSVPVRRDGVARAPRDRRCRLKIGHVDLISDGPAASLRQRHQHGAGEAVSIHLVLAALLAAPHPRGRVLILDELADSLGAEHRREVLDAIATVAKDHGITILATCQDAIMAEARPYCGEVLYFHYPSRSAPLNCPTRMFGFDPNGTRVKLTTEALIEGRSLV